MTEEVRSPARDLPRAMLVSLGITTLLHVLVSLAVVTLGPSAELAGSAAPLALAIEKVWSGAGGLVSAIALFANATTVLITLIATSRLAFSMTCDGEIPAICGKILRNRHTPWTATILALTMSAALLPIGEIKTLAEFSSFSRCWLSGGQHRTDRAALSAPRASSTVPVAAKHWQNAAAAGAGDRFDLSLLANFEFRIYLAGAIALALALAVFFCWASPGAAERWGEITTTAGGSCPPFLSESMRHQCRHSHALEHSLRRTAQNEFSQAGVSVAAHHDQVGRRIGGIGEDRACHVDVLGDNWTEFHPELDAPSAVRSRRRQIRLALARFNHDDIDGARALEHGHRIRYGTGRVPAPVPVHHYPINLETECNGTNKAGVGSGRD